MSKVLELEAHNVMGVRDIRFDLEGHHLFLVGGNNFQGKTSALIALLMALCGKKGMDGYPEVALREGAKKGVVKVKIEGDADVFGIDNTGPMTAELRWRRKASGKIEETFRLYDESGEEAPTPRTLLQKLFALKAFDPLSFAKMKPQDQAKLVQKLLGIDLDKFEKRRSIIFDERRQIGVEGKKLAGHFESLTFHKDAPDKEESVTDMMSEMEKLTEQMNVRRKMEEAVLRHRDNQAELVAHSDKLTKQIKELQEQLDKTKAELAEQEKAEKEKESKLESDPEYADCSDAVREMRERLASVDETNRKVRSNAEYKRVQKELKESRERYTEKTDEIKEIDEQKAQAIESAPWPVEGMELQQDGLLMNGLPFSQASTAQRIMASTKIGMALNPKLRLLVCEHGSDLDAETLNALEKAAKEHDFQILIELVTRTSEDEARCAVIIKDGMVAGDAVSSDQESDE